MMDFKAEEHQFMDQNCIGIENHQAKSILSDNKNSSSQINLSSIGSMYSKAKEFSSATSYFPPISDSTITASEIIPVKKK